MAEIAIGHRKIAVAVTCLPRRTEPRSPWGERSVGSIGALSQSAR
jgi:hypothetical protein